MDRETLERVHGEKPRLRTHAVACVGLGLVWADRNMEPDKNQRWSIRYD
uniref:Uncharacterized protein n=1 Tax=Candidatus Kentrum eta TaxID=2126337 RepID=A0A450UN55_9GAMM|nr:MAG: hypothetical protein BECKH772A_GA0070896_100647 [Candidatus Kentron sp. H]VFJ94717.1 MAG: hypothetical protein BECKH772B_GA0070898_100667 [Candidatus Kentron sp. H]VFK01335.1 MAG: hypothetical protein BECKH772C_GA0070978_100636 [Candidatus Kentron sp. H]